MSKSRNFIIFQDDHDGKQLYTEYNDHACKIEGDMQGDMMKP